MRKDWLRSTALSYYSLSCDHSLKSTFLGSSTLVEEVADLFSPFAQLLVSESGDLIRFLILASISLFFFLYNYRYVTHSAYL